MMKKNLLAAAAAGAALSAQAEMATYAIDPTHTFVMYEVLHFGTSTNRGRFEKKEGTVRFDKAAGTGKVEIIFDVASVDSGVEMLDKHLQGPDFFDAAKYPTAKFVGDRFTLNGVKVAQVSGQLTLRGKTQPVTLKATRFNCFDHPLFKREVCGGDFETTIKRSQWGIDYGVASGIPDDVRLLVQVEAIRQ
jgi:polyisoprenoid-binding protein YceI